MLATHSTFKRFILSTTLVVGVLTAASVVQPHAKAVGNSTDWPCCAVSTKGIEIEQGQAACFELKNTGDESIAVHLQFIDKEGKALQQRDATIKPGKTEEMAFAPSFLGGVRLVELRAQFGTKEARSIGLLRPAFLIFDGASQKTIRSIGPEGFYPIPFGPHSADRATTDSSILPNSSFGSTTAAITFGGSLRDARLTVKNIGAEPAVVKLQFVDTENKVLVQREAMITPGSDETLELPNLQGSFRAQFTTKQARSIGLLRPQLLISDRESRQTVQIIGVEGFKNFQPAELRPGNDPD